MVSDIVEKFICSMMWEGKKSTAQRVFYGAMDQVAKKTSDDALKIFKKAIENLKPLSKSRRGAWAAPTTRCRWKSIRSAGSPWPFAGCCSIRANAPARPWSTSLPTKLIDAANSRGGAIKKKEDVHRMAEANKAFAHYRW